jgi:hypothetical protein
MINKTDVDRLVHAAVLLLLLVVLGFLCCRQDCNYLDIAPVYGGF